MQGLQNYYLFRHRGSSTPILADPAERAKPGRDVGHAHNAADAIMTTMALPATAAALVQGLWLAPLAREQWEQAEAVADRALDWAANPYLASSHKPPLP
jgi:hypothetical protein